MPDNETSSIEGGFPNPEIPKDIVEDKLSDSELASADTVEPSNDLSGNFHLIEYEKLRDELMQIRKSRDEVFTLTVAANAAASSWLIASFSDRDAPSIFVLFGSMLPLWISVASWAYWNNRNNLIKKLSAYVSELEAFMSKPNLGWQKYLDKSNDEKSFGAKYFVKIIYAIQILLGLIMIIILPIAAI